MSVDNGPETIVNRYNTARLDGVHVFTSASLPSGPHTLRVRVLGQTGTPGGGVWGNVDRLVVENSAWTLCASEGQTCGFSGTAEVRFGAAGVAARGVHTGGVACTTSVFGNPIAGAKQCYYRSVATSRLVAQHSGSCAGVASSAPTAGADVIQWSCTGVSDQTWTPEKVTTGYRLRPAHAPTMCLDVAGASTAPGANVLQWTCGTGANQVWSFVHRGEGFYQLRPTHAAGMCLDIAGAGVHDGADIVQYSCNGYPNQLWKLAP